MLAAGEGGKLRFQLFHITAADELGGIQHGLDIGVDLVLQGGILGFQVNKLHGITLPL